LRAVNQEGSFSRQLSRLLEHGVIRLTKSLGRTQDGCGSFEGGGGARMIDYWKIIDLNGMLSASW